MRIVVLLACLLFAPTLHAFESRVDTHTGTLEGAAWRIDVPADWNRTLVVYFHGYSVEPVTLPQTAALYPPLQDLVDRGYAVAQSAYAQTGWAVEQASADSERLRKHFVRLHGAPKRTLAMGMSMGGLLTVHALETQPKVYAGGLALCGVLAPADTLMQHQFAVRAAFDYYFPGLLGPLTPVPPLFMPDGRTTGRIDAALRSNPTAAAALRALQAGSDDDNLPGVIGFSTYVIGEMQRRAGGNPFDNRAFAYTGTGDDDALAVGVVRYTADAKATRYLSRWYTPTGRLERPLVALHTSRDPLVPASMAWNYAQRLRETGREANLVTRIEPREGHCTMSQASVTSAFDDLVGWLDGKHPDRPR